MAPVWKNIITMNNLNMGAVLLYLRRQSFLMSHSSKGPAEKARTKYCLAWDTRIIVIFGSSPRSTRNILQIIQLLKRFWMFLNWLDWFWQLTKSMHGKKQGTRCRGFKSISYNLVIIRRMPFFSQWPLAKHFFLRHKVGEWSQFYKILSSLLSITFEK